MIKSFVIVLIFIMLLAYSCDTAFEKDLAGKKVTLLAPTDNLTTTDTMHTFFWEEMDGASSYEVQVVSPNFSSIVKLVTDTVITVHTLKLDLGINTYQWRVRGLNNSSSSDYSSAWNLKIQ